MLKLMLGTVLLVLAGCGDPRCSMKATPGLCEAAIDSFYFDQKSQQCVATVWGGCDDGIRPFATMSECEAVCE